MTDDEREMLRYLYEREQKLKRRWRFYCRLLCVMLLAVGLGYLINDTGVMILLGVTLGGVYVFAYVLVKLAGWIIRNWRNALSGAIFGAAFVGIALATETWIFPPMEAFLDVPSFGLLPDFPPIGSLLDAQEWDRLLLQAKDYRRKSGWDPLVVLWFYAIEGPSDTVGWSL